MAITPNMANKKPEVKDNKKDKVVVAPKTAVVASTKPAVPAKQTTTVAKKEPAKATTAKKPATKACAKKSTAKKATKKSTASKKTTASKEIKPTFDSLYKAIEKNVKKAKFTSNFIATQITLKGNIDPQPLYVKIENKKAEVAPYNYNDATFFLDADAEVMAAILNGKKTIYEALETGSVTINGDASMAVLFIKALFA